MVDTEVNQRARIMGESEGLVASSLNTDTQLSRCRLILEHAAALLRYEKLDIPTILPPPSEVIAHYQPIEKRLASAQRHYLSLLDEIKAAKRSGDTETAERLLLEAIASTEAESKARGCGVAPWYYEQLAILYRKQKRVADEVSVLKRYAGQPKAPGVGPKKLADRLTKAIQLAGKQ